MYVYCHTYLSYGFISCYFCIYIYIPILKRFRFSICNITQAAFIVCKIVAIYVVTHTYNLKFYYKIVFVGVKLLENCKLIHKKKVPTV